MKVFGNSIMPITSPDQKPSFSSIVKGRRVFVLGSAPDASLDGYSNNDVLISINGSMAPFDKQIVPDILVLNAYTTSVRGEVSDASMASMNGRKARHLLVIETGARMEESSLTLEKSGFSFESCEALSRHNRRALTERAVGHPVENDRGSHVLSTGAVALALAVESKADYLYWSGFSFEDGHSYLTTKTRRGHAKVDAEMFLRLLGVSNPSKDNACELL